MKHLAQYHVFAAAIAIFCAGCYGLPESSIRITDAEVISQCKVVAVSVVTRKLRYPLFEFSGWSRGVPKTHDQYGEIYYFDLEKRSLKRAAVIRPPGGFEQQFDVTIGWLDNDGLYLTLSGYSRDNRYKLFYKRLLSNGRMVAVEQIPAPPQRISEQYKMCTGYLQGQVVTTGPTGGPWKEVLYLDENGKLSVYK